MAAADPPPPSAVANAAAAENKSGGEDADDSRRRQDNDNPQAKPGDVIAGWKVVSYIGSGSFGDIFLAEGDRPGLQAALKFERLTVSYPQLEAEMKIGAAIRHPQPTGFPQVYGLYKTQTSIVLAMELLGENLETLFTKCNRRFSLKTVALIAIQIIDRLRQMHERDFIHRDIKPENFMTGVGGTKDVIHVIDLGLAKSIRLLGTSEHIPYRDKKKLTGTPRYASTNTHHGLEQSRRDDLESLGYMLMYFNSGRLPWQGLRARNRQEKYDKIFQKKLQTPIQTLCMGHPAEFADFLEYTRKLRFFQTPDYKYLRGLFIGMMNRLNYTNDGRFDWEIPENERGPSSTMVFLATMKITSLNSCTPQQIAILIQNEEYARREVFRLASESQLLRRKFDYYTDRFQQQTDLLRTHCQRVAPGIPPPNIDDLGVPPAASDPAAAAARAAAARAVAMSAAAGRHLSALNAGTEEARAQAQERRPPAEGQPEAKRQRQ